jgi:signal transduction histidine kinase
MMPILRSLTARYLLSHVLVTLLTIVLLLALVLISLTDAPPGMLFARYYASGVASDWLLPPGYYEPVDINLPPVLPGFDMVVSPDNEVVYARGEDLPCQVGETLTVCAPEYLDRPTGEESIQANDRDWIDVTLILTAGYRVIARLDSQTATDTFSDMISLVPFVGVVTLASIPAALLLSWLLARGQIRRFRRITDASQHFADGDFGARVNDNRKDVLGKLGQQFDTMAQALESNIGALRSITQQLMQARQRGEAIAAQNERLRLSRELHDDIAQRLFSLTAASTSLPDLIRRDPAQGAERAQSVADIAQQTLLDLRGLLANLRSSELEIYGLYDGLTRLCQTWEETHHVPVHISIVLSGKPLLPSLEESVFRLVQEGLHNIAKHAHAHSVQMTLIEGQRQLRFSLSDDGRGFDTSETHPGKFGLLGMRERVRALGGMFSLESGENGTTLTVILPLQLKEGS